MATRVYENIVKPAVADDIEKLAGEAEILVVEDDSRKDLKERRKVTKEHFYVGPYKLKHMLPKGKHI
jgi:hypothetical protein